MSYYYQKLTAAKLSARSKRRDYTLHDWPLKMHLPDMVYTGTAVIRPRKMILKFMQHMTYFNKSTGAWVQILLITCLDY